MDQVQEVVAVQNAPVAAPSKKELKELFGSDGTPLPKDQVQDVFVAEMEHDSNAKGITTKKWYVRLKNGQRRHLNTYGGKVGKNLDVTQFTYAGLGDSEHAKKLKSGGFVPTTVESCPFIK